jgi:hypothetical protein
VTWGALGRVTEAAVRVVSNPLAVRPRPTHPHHPSDATATRAGCLWCDINALRAALADAGTPGVLVGPGHPSPPAAAPGGPPPESGAGGDHTSGTWE